MRTVSKISDFFFLSWRRIVLLLALFLLLAMGTIAILAIISARTAPLAQAPSVSSAKEIGLSDSLSDERKAEAPMAGALMGSAAVQNAAPASKAKKADRGENRPTHELSKNNESDKNKAEKRMVHYQGNIKLAVDYPSKILEVIEKKTEQLDGFVESLKGNRIVVRIPVAGAKQFFKAVLELGIVIEKSLRSDDITDEFTDTTMRLQTQKALLEKLNRLMLDARNDAERLTLLTDIQGIMTDINKMEMLMRELQQKAAYSSFIIDLQPRVNPVVSFSAKVFPEFLWIYRLNPLQTSLAANGHFFRSLPEGFVGIEQVKPFYAESADGGIIRLGTVANDPLGNVSFWRDAVKHHLSKRYVWKKEESQEDRGVLGFAMQTGEAIRYFVSVRVKEDKVFVIEETYYSPEQAQKHHGAVLKILDAIWPE